MRLARNVLEGVAGLEIYPIIGIFIFLCFFAGVVIWVVRLKKTKVEEYSKMPLDDDETSASAFGNNDSSKHQKD